MGNVTLTPNTELRFIGSDEHVALYAVMVHGAACGLVSTSESTGGQAIFRASTLAGTELEGTRSRYHRSVAEAARTVLARKLNDYRKRAQDVSRRLFDGLSERADAMGELVRIQAEYDALSAEFAALAPKPPPAQTPPPALVGVNGSSTDDETPF